jgi:hypothetical protein
MTEETSDRLLEELYPEERLFDCARRPIVISQIGAS